MHTDLVFVLMFVVATAVAVGARWLRVPYTVALVVAGLVLGATGKVQAPHLTKDLLFTLILPGLVFEAAFHLDAASFWRERVAIHSLAVPGVMAAIALTAAIVAPVGSALALVSGFGVLHALVFAALIVATDPIAVLALFKNVGAPARLRLIVEGESLVNDGTGIVLFSIVIGFQSDGHIALGRAAVEFVRVVGVGAAVGLLVGFAVAQAIRRIDDAMIELTLTIVAAYGSFTGAEHFAGSGVIATLAAGMVCGNYAAHVGMSPTTRVAVETAWDYAAFALNSIVFLLIGFEVRLTALVQSWRPILVAYGAVMVARIAVVYAVTALLRPSRSRLPWKWSAAITWSGLRGALSMVLALGLPADFPQRAVVLNMTFGVVLLSILLQGLTMAPVLRWLGLTAVPNEARKRHDRAQAEAKAAAGALLELERVESEQAVAPAIVGELREDYRRRLERAQAEMRTLHDQDATLGRAEARAARHRLVVAERDAVTRAIRHGSVSAEGAAEALTAIDERLRALDESGD